jgi:hypothetical protein
MRRSLGFLVRCGGGFLGGAEEGDLVASPAACGSKVRALRGWIFVRAEARTYLGLVRRMG